jgi:hypothetical protein
LLSFDSQLPEFVPIIDVVYCDKDACHEEAKHEPMNIDLSLSYSLLNVFVLFLLNTSTGKNTNNNNFTGVSPNVHVCVDRPKVLATATSKKWKFLVWVLLIAKISTVSLKRRHTTTPTISPSLFMDQEEIKGIL